MNLKKILAISTASAVLAASLTGCSEFKFGEAPDESSNNMSSALPDIDTSSQESTLSAGGTSSSEMEISSSMQSSSSEPQSSSSSEPQSSSSSKPQSSSSSKPKSSSSSKPKSSSSSKPKSSSSSKPQSSSSSKPQSSSSSKPQSSSSVKPQSSPSFVPVSTKNNFTGFSAVKTANGTKLSWSPVKNCKQYYVYRADSDGCYMLDVLNNNETSFLDSGVSDIEDITYYVEASVPKNGELVTYTSNTATISGKIKAPGVALTIGNGKATVRWSKENADGYIVLMDGKQIYDTKSGNVTSYTRTGLTNYELHGFSVKAYKNINGKTVYGPKSKSVFTREYNVILDSARTDNTRSYSLINRQGATDKTSTVNLSDNDFAIMEKFAKEHFTPEMSDTEKLITTLDWISRNVAYAQGSDWDKIGNKSYVDAAFNYKLGQCAQYNGAMVSMLRYLGYNANLILGWRGNSSSKKQHLWGEVEIDGTRYLVEAQSFGVCLLAPYELSDGRYIMNNKNAQWRELNDAYEESDFEYGGYTNTHISGYKGKNTALKIPAVLNGAEVTAIASNAFSGRADITSVAIPNSVGSIGSGTFRDCTGLTGMIIPSGIKRIGISTFSGCKGLKNITLPDSIIEIADNAFYECGSLESITIPNSVKEIGDSAFLRCTALTSVTIPDSVTTIEEQAFQDCAGITSVKIPNSITRIEDYVFKGCSGLTDVTIPNSVTSIGSKAFLDCSGLTSVTIPNSVTSMGIMAFSGCGLTSVTIPGSITKIDTDAFFDCSGLTSVTIGSGVTSLEAGAFGRCTGLTNVTIPNSVTSIARHAFYNCTSLADLMIPDSVTKIEEGAFEGCKNIQATYKGNTYDYEHIDDLYKAING